MTPGPELGQNNPLNRTIKHELGRSGRSMRLQRARPGHGRPADARITRHIPPPRAG